MGIVNGYIISQTHFPQAPWVAFLVVASGYFLSFACVGHPFIHQEFSVFKIIFWVSFQEVELLSQGDYTF